MLRKLFFLPTCLFAFLFSNSPGIADVSDISFRCGGPFDLCGYVDRKSGQTLIPFKFEDALPFSEGLAAVKREGKWGYVDSLGSMVIEPRFDLAGTFSSGHAEVVIDNHAGVIDRNGKVVVETQFARAIPFTEDVVLVAEGQRRLEDRFRLAPLDELSSIFIKKRLGLYRIDQGWISKKRYKVAYFDKLSRGLIWASEAKGKEPLFGLLKADGSWQVTPRYTSAYWLIDDFATVQGIPDEVEPKSPQTVKRMSGAVDRNGKLVIPLNFEGLSYWMGGYGLARKYDNLSQLGLVTRRGELLTGRYYENVDRPTDGRWPRVLENGLWRSVTPEGDLVPDQRNGHVHVSCPKGLQVIELNGLFAIRHLKLDTLVKTKVSAINKRFSDDFCLSPYLVSIGDNQYKFVTQDGRTLPSKGWYDNVLYVNEGLSAVFSAGKWGVIDDDGQFLVPPLYDKLQIHRHNKTWFVVRSQTGPQKDPVVLKVEQNGREFWIDTHNKEVVKPRDPTKEESEAILACGGMLKRFEENGLWGMIGPSGRVIIDPDYRALTCFRRGVAWGALKQKKLWCPIGSDGRQKVALSCRKSVDVVGRTETRPEELSQDPHENSVLWLRALLDYAQGKRPEPPGVLGMTF